MAQELTTSVNFAFTKPGSLSVGQNYTKAVDVAGDYTASGVQLIGTSDETFTFPSDLATVGFCVFQNLDATNFVLIGSDGTNYPIKLLPGEFAMMRFNGTPHVKADTAACRVAFTIIQE